MLPAAVVCSSRIRISSAHSSFQRGHATNVYSPARARPTTLAIVRLRTDAGLVNSVALGTHTRRLTGTDVNGLDKVIVYSCRFVSKGGTSNKNTTSAKPWTLMLPSP